MFDDLHQNNNQGIPAPAEDIFASADPVKEKQALKPAPFQPKAVPAQNPVASSIPQPAMAAPMHYEEMDSGNGKKFFVLGLTILVMAGVVYGLFFAFSKFGNPFAKKQAVNLEEQPKIEEQPVLPTTDAGNQVQPSQIAPTENKSAPETEQPQTPVAATIPAVKDSDQDGLTDDEETNTYHTNPNLTDTDEDGLFDREEVMVYHTDPLLKDTDGDSYSDGSEVKGGYNPNGPGKLYDITKP